MLKIRSNSNFKKTRKYLVSRKERLRIECAEKYAERGLEALRKNTPKDTSLTSQSWSYEVLRSRDRVQIIYSNSNVNDGANIAILLQLGHGTGTGGYVRGVDYINPAIQPVFKDLADEAWREMKSIE